MDDGKDVRAGSGGVGDRAAVDAALEMIRESQVLAGIYAMARWAPAMEIVTSVILGLIATVRLWRWDHGHSQLVCECGGLLGRERPGRFGAYRKCLACNRNVNEEYYT